MAKVVEIGLGRPPAPVARRLGAYRRGKFVRTLSHPSGQTYSGELGIPRKEQLARVMQYLRLERAARAHLRACGDTPMGVFHMLDPTGFQDFGAGEAMLSAADLRDLVDGSGRLVSLNIRAPLQALRSAARKLATSNGRGRGPVILLDPFDYDAPADEVALMRGVACLAQIQAQRHDGWALIALPPGIFPFWMEGDRRQVARLVPTIRGEKKRYGHAEDPFFSPKY
jgi:hypothetical protein